MRVLAVLAVLALALYALALVGLALGQRRLIYPGAYRPPPPHAVPPGVAVVTVATPDGERLHGLWHPPRPGCGVVVTFHGNGARPEPHAARFSQGPWRAAGWGVLAVAYRGYPGSTGAPSEDGLIRDGLAAAAEVAARAPGAPVLLHGHSLGAAVAVAVAERVPHRGLYLEAPFDSLVNAVRVHFPYVPTLLLRDTFRSDRRVAGGTAPVLIVQGEADRIVPAELARRLEAAIGPRARLDLIPGDHVSILGARDAEAAALFRTACADAAVVPG
ncbi:alpha/beta hydrolase [Methylobacterium sp. NEAU 140]|uniref:alpha/beta hydrolase n=1 Tax=Methylobacterium sp. NEAU 140 TaxID=3064945 RepID=UPI002733334A|nr:alpha/beta hydrolase [Methylobacterium sp. NEAU 140]MDP4021861.1 alpha/beta hydrolase [Methylobacterium sp. NEAU 140]